MSEDINQTSRSLGMDGKLWAEEMHKQFPDIEKGHLLGWCCNMIMAGYDEAMRRANKRDGELTRLPALIAAVEAHEQLLNTVLIAWGRHLGGWDESKATPEDMEAYKYLHGEVTGHDTAAAKAHRCPTVKLDHIATSEESNSYICPECMRVYLVKNGDGQ